MVSTSFFLTPKSSLSERLSCSEGRANSSTLRDGDEEEWRGGGDEERKEGGGGDEER